MQVPLIDGALTCPKCGRKMWFALGKYGAAITNACADSFRLCQGIDGMYAIFEEANKTLGK